MGEKTFVNEKLEEYLRLNKFLEKLSKDNDNLKSERK